jgi:hypothetical protein
MTSTATNRTPAGRRPNEAIQHRQDKSAECEQRVRKALTKLARTNAPFTIEDVCTVAGVGKTFIYDKRRPELTKAVLTARDQSQAAQRSRSEQALDGEALSWRDRALNAEALAKTLRATVKQRDVQIADLTGQLYDPDGNYLAEQSGTSATGTDAEPEPESHRSRERPATTIPRGSPGQHQTRKRTQRHPDHLILSAGSPICPANAVTKVMPKR